MVLNPRCDIWKYFDNIITEGIAVCKLCNQRLKNNRSFTLKKHIDKLHNPKSEIWKYYDNDVEKCVAVCKICKKHVQNNRHLNLFRHLWKHKIFLKSDNKNPPKNNLKSVDSGYALRTEDKNNIQSREILCINMEEKILVEALVGLMINEGINPELFVSKNMQALLSPMCAAISKQEDTKFSVDKLQSEKALHSIANYIEEEFHKELHWRLLSLKIDMDINSDLNRFYISVQFVNDTKLETRVLGDISLDKDQQLSGESIINTLRKYKIDPDQIVSAHWDNSKAKFNNPVSNSDYFLEINKFECNTDIYVSEIKVERYVGIIAQLCVLDVLKNPFISQLFMECRNLTKFINDNPNIFHEAFKQNNLNIPQLDSPWKWGSTYTMMNDLNEAQSIIENIKYQQPQCLENGFNFNENLKGFIQAFCKAISFVQKSSHKFYNSELIYGDFYTQWLKCKIVTEKLYRRATSDKENTLSLITSELLKSIDNRTVELLNRDYFKACLYLDPRFQHTLRMTEKLSAIDYLSRLWNRSKLFNTSLINLESETLVETETQTAKFDDDDGDAFLNEFLIHSVQEASSSRINKKLEDLKLEFKMVDTNVLSYWKELQCREPEIYNLSIICLAIPATQDYNKIIYCHPHLFSHTAKTSPSVTENIEIIRLNQHLLDKAIDKLKLFREINFLETEAMRESNADLIV